MPQANQPDTFDEHVRTFRAICNQLLGASGDEVVIAGTCDAFTRHVEDAIEEAPGALERALAKFPTSVMPHIAIAVALPGSDGVFLTATYCHDDAAPADLYERAQAMFLAAHHRVGAHRRGECDALPDSLEPLRAEIAAALKRIGAQ